MANERGNALFLILIAVALFAALSYAVTQSGRGGGGISKEQEMLQAASITQKISLLRSTAQRMALTGTPIDDLKLCAGADTLCWPDFGTGSFCTTGTDCIWAPEGGGVDINRFQGHLMIAVQSGGARTLAGHPTKQVFVMFLGDGQNIYSENTCRSLNRGYGLSETILEDVDSSNSINGDVAGGTLDGEWDFCLDNDDTATQVLISAHMLMAQ